jgi:nitric oxide reductase NorQ protein
VRCFELARKTSERKSEKKNGKSVEPVISGNEDAGMTVAPTSGVQMLGDVRNGIYYPKIDPTYITDNKLEQMGNVLMEAVRYEPQNVRVSGPHGCGKTEYAIQFAARHKLPVLIMDCANLREPRDWFGYRTVEAGNVIWVESLFDRAVSNGNIVIVFDEFTRTPPNVLNTLMPLLDSRRFTYIEEKGGVLRVGPGVFFFATMNEGVGYSGTSNLDFAIADRFPRVIEMSFLKPDDEQNLLVKRTGVDEKIAKDLVEIANLIRTKSRGLSSQFSKSVSTRQLLAAAHDFRVGGPTTLVFTVVNHFTSEGGTESERYAVLQMIQGKFGAITADGDKKDGKVVNEDTIIKLLGKKT